MKVKLIIQYPIIYLILSGIIVVSRFPKKEVAMGIIELVVVGGAILISLLGVRVVITKKICDEENDRDLPNGN